jgi:tRNA(fMet)-specific endonuclease VapC
MGILIDTSVLIATERGRFDLVRLFAAHPDEPFAIAAITASELLVGVHRSTGVKRDHRAAFVEAALARFFVVHFDLSVARVHAELSAKLTSAGLAVGLHDLQIAATSVARADRIATLDQRSFPHIPGVQLLPLP